MTSASGGGLTATFGYDDAGNMTGVSGALYGSKTLVYDDESRLASITYGGVTDTYTYNWQGLRTRAYLAGTYYRYLYNGERVLQELTDGGGVNATYTTENDSYYGTLLHLQRATGESRFPLYDGIGSARGLVDASGTVTDTYDMDTFGKPIATTGSTPNPYRFGAAWGYITDPSGMLQLGARFYWPELGRFISQDPIGDGMNWYAYVENKPTVAVDPAGLGCDDAFWKDVVDSQNAFFKCMLDELVMNDVRDADRLLRRISQWLVGAGVFYGSKGGAKVCQANAARAREIQVAYQNAQVAAGDVEFTGNAVTKGWSRRAITWARRAKPLKWVAKWAGRASAILTAARVGWAYNKCFGKLTF